MRLEWILKHISPILIWKKQLQPSTRGGYSYNHSAFMNLFQGKLCSFMGGFHLALVHPRRLRLSVQVSHADFSK